MAAIRQLCRAGGPGWAALLVAGLLLPTGLLATPARQPPSVAPQGAAAAATAEPAGQAPTVAALVKRFQRARLAADRAQHCLLTPGCAADEGRWLDAMESGRQALAGLSLRAQQGDAEAAYQRGVLGLELVQSHRARQNPLHDAQFPATAQALRRRQSEEASESERHLAMAAATGHAPACLALALHVSAERKPPPEAGLAAQLFRCAVLGFQATGKPRDAADAYAYMRDVLSPRDPMLVEAHAAVHRGKVPERSWRLVEPAQVEALRRSAAP